MQVTRCKMKEPVQFSEPVLYHIIRKRFVRNCPHCKEPIFNYEDPLDANINWNDVVGDQLPISGLIKPYPQGRRMTARLIEMYKRDEHRFFKERTTANGYINFFSEEDAKNYLIKVLIPELMPFDPAIFTDKDAATKRETEIQLIAEEQYRIIPVWIPEHIDYMFTAHTTEHNYTGKPDFEVVVTSDLFITLQNTKNLYN